MTPRTDRPERPLTAAIERPPDTEPGQRLLNMLPDYSGKGLHWRDTVQRYADVIREIEAASPPTDKEGDPAENVPQEQESGW